MAVPGRVDSSASAGSHKLLKQGGATLVTEPGDVIELLESPARHHFSGTHAVRYMPTEPRSDGSLFDAADRSPVPDSAALTTAVEPSGDPLRDAVLAALAESLTLDELLGRFPGSAGEIRATITMLEIERRVVRDGARLRRR
jgi:DNA processing protein